MTQPVTILLSTYNGARYLPDQLDSLVEQTHTDWRLRWRDDGSTDGSRALVEAFAAARPPGQVERLADDGVHRGIASSFLALIRAHVAAGQDDVIAFADQDDVWLPEKLARGVEALAEAAGDEPGLYCARQMLVSDRLRTLGPSPAIRRAPGFPGALAQNIATGCTVMLNAPACHLLAEITAPDNTLHDWWAYIVVSAVGGRILVDSVPTVLYRQHSGNAVGVAASRLRRAAVALRRGPAGFMTLLRAHIAALRAAGDHLAPSALNSLRLLERALAGGPRERIRLLRQSNVHRQTFAESVVFNVWFVIG